MHDYWLTSYAVAGCLPEAWMYPVVSITMMIFFAINIFIGFYLSKKSSFSLQLTGALMLYAFASSVLSEVLTWVFNGRHAFSFLKYSDQLSQTAMPIFGNALNYKLFSSSLSYLLQLIYAFLSYIIVFSVWTLPFRKAILTYGLVACGMGWYVWYFLVGPILFHR